MPAAEPRKLLQARSEGHTCILAVREPELYRADTVLTLGRELRHAIDAAGPGASFVLDLSAVTFMTSAAVGLVTNLRAHLDSRGYPFALAGAAGDVANVLRTTRLDEVMPVFPTVEQALAEFRCR